MPLHCPTGSAGPGQADRRLGNKCSASGHRFRHRVDICFYHYGEALGIYTTANIVILGVNITLNEPFPVYLFRPFLSFLPLCTLALLRPRSVWESRGTFLLF